MTFNGFRALWSYWWRNPWQLATLLAGIAVSTALWSGVQAINAEARASYARAAEVLDTSDLNRVVRQDTTAMHVNDFVSLRRLDWPVSPVLEGNLRIGDQDFRIVGIEPLTFPADLPSALADGGNLGDLFSDGSIGVAHPEDLPYLSQLETTFRSDPTRPRGSLLLDIARADDLLDAKGEISHLLLGPERPLGIAGLPSIYRIMQPLVQADVSRLTRSFHLNLTAFGLLSFAVGIFIVYGAVGLAFEQRRSVFRTLRALGVPLRSLMLFLTIELFSFALLAGAVGVAIGYGIAAALLPDVAATLRGLYGADVSGQLQFRAGWWLTGLGMALLGTGVATIATLAKLVHMPLLSFNHPRAMSLGAQAAGRWLALASLALFAVGALLALIGQGLFAGFALLACLLIGAAFLLPWCLARALSMAERLSRHPRIRWFWADSRQQLPGLSMALMALLLAMAANVGVSTMVSSFRLTFESYLDQRLASEIYVSVPDADRAAALQAFLKPRVDAVLPIVSVDTRIAGLPAEVFGVIDHPTYRDHWPLLEAEPDVWDRLAAEEGILVNEQLARREGWRVGQTVLTGDRLLGIYSDYGNASGQVILGSDLFDERYPDEPRLRFGVRTSTPGAILEALRDDFGLEEDGAINQSELKRFSLEIFERTFAVTAALNVLTLSVAGLAILISLLTLATMRLPQLAPVWALGMTRLQLSRIELLRAVCLSSLTAVLALPVGLTLAWVLLAIVNVEAFGWRLPMYLFPVDYLRLTAFTLIAACLAALWPALKIARTDPQALLKVFSNER